MALLNILAAFKWGHFTFWYPHVFCFRTRSKFRSRELRFLPNYKDESDVLALLKTLQSFWFHLKPKLYASDIFQQINFGPQSWKFGGSPSWSCGLWFSCSNIKLGDGRRGHGVYFNEFMFKHITRGIFEISLQHLGRIEEPPWFWKPLKGRTGQVLTMTIINITLLGDFKAIYKY